MSAKYHCCYSQYSSIFFRTTTSNTDSAELLSRDYNINVGSAETIIEMARGEADEQKLSDTGVTPSDLSSLNALKTPQRDFVDRVASALHEDSDKIENVMRDLVLDLKQNK